MTGELKELFYDRLGLIQLSPSMQEAFLKQMDAYISHGRTYEYIATNLDKLLSFFEIIGIGPIETSIILTNFSGILNITDELYEKYLFLGILENEDNSFRRRKFFTKTKDYRVSLHKIYARYRLCLDCGYDDIKWNTLVHATDTEFAKIFVVGTYRKKYQLFASIDEVKNYIDKIDVNELDIDEYKTLPVNEEIVARYEGKRRSH